MNDPIPSPEGFVLIGGASARMGRPKSELMIGGQKLFERSADGLRAFPDSQITLVGNVDPEDTHDYPIIRDIGTASGDQTRAPLIGLYTALNRATSPWIVIVACDMPFITRDLIATLWSFRTDDCDAIVPIQPDAKPQPLCAFYNRVVCLPIVGQMIENNDMKMQHLLSNVNTRFAQFNEIAHLYGAADFFLNINAPQDLETALGRVRPDPNRP